MYGWRARLGILAASGIIAPDTEMQRMAPEGGTCHVTKLPFTGGGTTDILQELRTAEQHVGDGSALIADVRPTAVALCATGASFVGGVGYDQMLIEKMKERNGNVPTTTGVSSVIAALKKLGIKKVSMGMPYVEPVAKAGMKFIEDSGIKIMKAKWLGLRDSWEIAQVTKGTLYEMVKEIDQRESEAIFISCTALNTIEIIEILEADFQKPVVTTNQATMWNLLRMSHVNEKIEGFGQLFSRY
jgi:maleate isomerase